MAAVESFDTIDACADRVARGLGDGPGGLPVFMLPRWIKTWRRVFESDLDDELHMCLVGAGEDETSKRLIGVAPLSISGATASFVGDPEICDYLDFDVKPGYEREFFDALLDHLSKRGITQLDLRCLRPESAVISHLAEVVRDRGGACSFEPDGVSLEMELPGGWDDYLSMLDGRQRHEIRRKLRRLGEKGEMEFLALKEPGEIVAELDTFLKMFKESREDKAAFMNPKMETFFRSMVSAMSEEGIMRLFFLKLSGQSVATALCFDHRETMHLYNSGYDPDYGSLSVGLLCKVLSIRHSIETGRKKYDFLKGAEPYKSRLGGREVHLSRCRVDLPPNP